MIIRSKISTFSIISTWFYQQLGWHKLNSWIFNSQCFNLPLFLFECKINFVYLVHFILDHLGRRFKLKWTYLARISECYYLLISNWLQGWICFFVLWRNITQHNILNIYMVYSFFILINCSRFSCTLGWFRLIIVIFIIFYLIIIIFNTFVVILFTFIINIDVFLICPNNYMIII